MKLMLLTAAVAIASISLLSATARVPTFDNIEPAVPRSVSANIVHSVQSDRQVVLHLPRDTILFVSEYPRLSLLPDEFTTRGWLTFKLRAAYRGSLPDASDARRVQRLRSRFEHTAVEVHVVGRDIPTIALFGQYHETRRLDAELVELPPFEGLRSVEYRIFESKNGKKDLTKSRLATNESRFFPTSANDLFDVISCFNEDRHPVKFCQYRKRLSDLVRINAKFVDFRFHGGRKFVNDRMRFVLESYCEYDPACGWPAPDKRP